VAHSRGSRFALFLPHFAAAHLLRTAAARARFARGASGGREAEGSNRASGTETKSMSFRHARGSATVNTTRPAPRGLATTAAETDVRLETACRDQFSIGKAPYLPAFPLLIRHP
jgi:hypothetical protein